MGVRGAKSWEGGGGFKVIIHHIGKRWGQFSSWGGGGVTPPEKIKPQAKNCRILVFMLYYIIYIIYIYILYIL